MLRRSEGDFDEILAGADVVVELIGGTDPARDYVLRALARRQARDHREQAAGRPARRRAVRGRARAAGVQLRFEAAVAGVVPVIRVIQESLAATRIEKVFGIVNGTTNFILSEMAATGASYDESPWPAPRSSATPRPTRPRTSAAPTRRRRWRSSPASRSTRPVEPRRRHLRGDHGDPARRPRVREGARPVAEAARRRRAPRRGDQRPRLPLLPQRRPPARADRGPVQRGHGRGARRSPRSRCPGPGAGGRADRDGGARRPRFDPLRRRPGRPSRAPGSR